MARSKRDILMTHTKAMLVERAIRSEAEATFWHEEHIALSQRTGTAQIMPWTARQAIDGRIAAAESGDK